MEKFPHCASFQLLWQIRRKTIYVPSKLILVISSRINRGKLIPSNFSKKALSPDGKIKKMKMEAVSSFKSPNLIKATKSIKV
jgi:hypothetical protein